MGWGVCHVPFIFTAHILCDSILVVFSLMPRIQRKCVRTLVNLDSSSSMWFLPRLEVQCARYVKATEIVLVLPSQEYCCTSNSKLTLKSGQILLPKWYIVLSYTIWKLQRDTISKFPFEKFKGICHLIVSPTGLGWRNLSRTSGQTQLCIVM